MAEDDFSDGSSGGGEEPGRRGDDGIDPIAAALAVSAASRGTTLDPHTAAYLDEQTRLARLRADSFADDNALATASARLKRWSDLFKLAFQVFVALVALALLSAFTLMLYDAVSSRSVVVDAFDAPPALAGAGLSGQVVADGLLDKLSGLQAATRSTAAKHGFATAWGNQIKIQVPETGVSVGEIASLLKQRFGHDLHVGGALVQTPAGGLALTVRGDGVPAKAFAGGRDDLDRLITQAAEYVYGQSEPPRFVVYLADSGRDAEAVVFAKANYARATPEQRPALLNQWANSLSNIGGTPAAALALYREEIRIKPESWVGYNNVMNTQLLMGREQAAWRTGQLLLKLAGGRPGKAPEIYYQNADLLVGNLQTLRAALQADAAAHGGLGTGAGSTAISIADMDVRLHDDAAAWLTLQTAQSDPSDTWSGAMRHFIIGGIATHRGDIAAAAREMEAFRAGFADPGVSSNSPGYDCWIAPAEEAAGYPDKADAVLAAAGSYLDCYRFRGDILDHRGDWAGAQKAYQAALALAPDLPAGYYSYGLALARHGDPAGALRELTLANARGPRWADPLKAWGDVLAQQGDWAGAKAKYDLALPLAPAWPDLRRARAAAAAHTG